MSTDDDNAEVDRVRERTDQDQSVFTARSLIILLVLNVMFMFAKTATELFVAVCATIAGYCIDRFMHRKKQPKGSDE